MLALAVAAMLLLAAILQLSQYATFGNIFILWQYFDFAKGYMSFFLKPPNFDEANIKCLQYIGFHVVTMP